MDIGGAFFFEQERTVRFATGNLLPYSLAEFRQAANRGGPGAAPEARASGLPPVSGFLLGLQNLPALVHAGLQIEVVRAAQLAGILVLGIGRLLQRVRRTAHATARGRC